MLSEAAVTRFSFYASWGILLVLFVCAYVQGPDFASTKESATVFGCAIGVTAFFSWLEGNWRAVAAGGEGGTADAADLLACVALRRLIIQRLNFESFSKKEVHQ